MHSLWKGALSFGLIHIPVRLYSASQERELKFKMLHKKDLSEIRYARICKKEEKEVPWDDIVKGFEIEEGHYVILSDEDFEKVNLKKTRTVEIVSFANEEDIDPIYYHNPYFLEPEKGAAKAYHLLKEALLRSKKVAIGQFVFHHHEHLGVIRPYGNLLMLHQLRYASELVNPKGLMVPKQEASSKKELEVAIQLIEQLTQPFKPQNYSDTYIDEVKEMIHKKSKGHKLKIKKGEEPKASKVSDIMSLLKASLKDNKKKKKSVAA